MLFVYDDMLSEDNKGSYIYILYSISTDKREMKSTDDVRYHVPKTIYLLPTEENKYAIY